MADGTKAQLRAALAELGAAAEAVDEQAVAQACQMIAAARTVVLGGCGREALQLRGLAMRLFHLGLRAAMQGDTACPPVGAGDLFMCSAGPGDLATVTALMQRAKDTGAAVLLLTAEPHAAGAALADRLLVIPAQTMASDQDERRAVLPMGSAYEGALFVLFEVMVLKLRELLGATAQQMRERHANLE